jgi:hypothetical protein
MVGMISTAEPDGAQWKAMTVGEMRDFMEHKKMDMHQDHAEASTRVHSASGILVR